MAGTEAGTTLKLGTSESAAWTTTLPACIAGKVVLAEASAAPSPAVARSRHEYTIFLPRLPFPSYSCALFLSLADQHSGWHDDGGGEVVMGAAGGSLWVRESFSMTPHASYRTGGVLSSLSRRSW